MDLEFRAPGQFLPFRLQNVSDVLLQKVQIAYVKQYDIILEFVELQFHQQHIEFVALVSLDSCLCKYIILNKNHDLYIHTSTIIHLLLVQYKQICHTCSNCHWTLVVCHNQLSQLCLAWI